MSNYEKLMNKAREIEEMCQNEGFTLGRDMDCGVSLSLHYRDKDGKIVTLRRQLTTIPF